ncbi:MAG: aminotransferase class IV [Clostridia bacterium]|nr:aminotransferase class IV [Clostridia bacterium]
MQDNVGALYILNGAVESSEMLEHIQIPEKGVVYEVIRIIDRVPLYLEDHYERLKNSLELLGKEVSISEKDLKQRIRELVDANQLTNCNVRIIVYSEDKRQHCLLHISKSYYPGREEIEKGVPVSLFRWERQNPNAKVVNQTYKDEVNRKMKEDNVFEVLLVNSDENITEGSRTNAFFIKGSQVFTAPGEYVLKGITRQYIIEACKRVGAEVVETLVNVNSLDEMEGLFISGTSIKVFPVCSIEQRNYNSGVHPTIVAIRDEFDRMVEEYVLTHKG